MPNLYEQAADYRARLLAGEETAASLTVRRYGQAYATIKRQQDALLREIETARRKGQTISPTWLRRQERFQALLRGVEREIAQFAQFAAENVRLEQAAAVRAATTAAPVLVAAATGSERPGVLVNWNRMPAEAFRDLVGYTADGMPLAKLLAKVGPAARESVSRHLTSSVTQGRNPRVIADDIAADLGGNLLRARLIARTEVLRAYRESSIRSYAANPETVEKWRWTASKQGRTCAMCLAMDGREFPLDVPFGSHPGCRCVAVPVVKSAAEIFGDPSLPDLRPVRETGDAWFARQPRDLQLRILGPAKLERFQAGSLTLSDLVGYRDDPQWGPTRWERSLKSLELV